MQSGYGFVHYDLNDEGVSAALRAVQSVHGKTINQVLYEVTVTHGLKTFLQLSPQAPFLASGLLTTAENSRSVIKSKIWEHQTAAPRQRSHHHHQFQPQQQSSPPQIQQPRSFFSQRISESSYDFPQGFSTERGDLERGASLLPQHARHFSPVQRTSFHSSSSLSSASSMNHNLTRPGELSSGLFPLRQASISPLSLPTFSRSHQGELSIAQPAAPASTSPLAAFSSPNEFFY